MIASLNLEWNLFSLLATTLKWQIDLNVHVWSARVLIASIQVEQAFNEKKKKNQTHINVRPSTTEKLLTCIRETIGR